MKQFMTKASALFVLAAMTACSEDAIVEFNPNLNNSEFLQEIKITSKDLLYDGETRSSVSITESGASFTWDEDDVIGIFPNEGDQVSFAMDKGAGTQTATFSGGGWALKSSATYAAYYPHVYENRDMTKIPVSYVGQTQNGNNNTDHIGAYDFMAAGVSTPSNGKVAFDMQHLGCLVQLKITIPNTGTLSSVTLSSDEEIFVEKGYIDLSATTPSIVPTQTTSSLNIDLKDVVTTVTNETVIIYFMMAPVDMTGKTLAIKVGDIVGIVEANNFEKGKAYQLKTTNPIAVDLGLSVKWANCNIGAHSPEEFGNYYAWGEVEEKTDYNFSTYKWCNGDACSQIKYCDNSHYGTVDNKTALDPEDDVAHVMWDGNWRMPTRAEQDELRNECSWSCTSINGVNGYQVTGPNGNSIFLPAAGYRYYEEVRYRDTRGFYWSATLCPNNNSEAKFLGFTDSGYNSYNGLRYCGYTIRPVIE